MSRRFMMAGILAVLSGCADEEGEEDSAAEGSVTNEPEADDTTGMDSTEDESTESNIGYELIEASDPSATRAWIISEAISQEDYDAIEVESGWVKNQLRELEFDQGVFTRSPDGAQEGDLTEEMFHGYLWFHSATITERNIPIDDQGIFLASNTLKYHELYYNPGRTITFLHAPDGELYLRVNRDYNRTTDGITLPDGWNIRTFTTPSAHVIVLPSPTLVFRTDNNDSYQGPISPSDVGM
ncbi:MAG: hypothetical protein AAFV53_21225 [Myxococcota bacterium]